MVSQFSSVFVVVVVCPWHNRLGGVFSFLIVNMIYKSNRKKLKQEKLRVLTYFLA